MNRTIKFRVWDVASKTMEEVTDINFKTGAVNGRFRPLTVLMQYTGLKDKNDKEIYEGDAINYCTGWASDSTHIEKRSGIVKFEQGMLGIKMQQHGNEMLKLTGFTDLEVIGNSYQNTKIFGDT